MNIFLKLGNLYGNINSINQSIMKSSFWFFLKFSIIGFSAIQIISGQGNINKSANDSAIPAELFFRKEVRSGFSLSPDGGKLAYIIHEGKSQNLVIENISDGKLLFTTSDSISAFPPVNIFNKSPYYWINDSLLVFCKDIAGNMKYMIFSANLTKNEVKCLTDFQNSSSAIITASTDKENEVLIDCNKRDPKSTDIYRLDDLAGDMKLIYQDDGVMKVYYADNDGKIRLARTQVGLMKYNEEKRNFDLILPARIGESFYPVAFSPDNKTVYAFSNIGRDRMAIIEYDFNQMNVVRIICENPQYDIWSLEESNDAISETSQLIYSPELRKLLYANYFSEKYELVFFDDETKKRFDYIKDILGKYEYKMISYSDDYDKLLFRISSGALKGAFYYFDYGAKKTKLLWRLSNWLPEKGFAEVRNISYQTRDGQKIYGYLTIPTGSKLKGLPVIINAHGGPMLRDIPGYNDINQFFANLGYTVMQINYRGSKGYGNDFEKLGYKQWGLRMQDDITDGVNWLIKEGIADKNRIGIYGFSSGGYNVLAGMTFTPGLFACGISISGNVNLFPYYNSIPKNYRELFGDPVKDSIQIVNTSPLFHAKKLVNPLMIVNGARDRGIPINEVDSFVDELKRNGTGVEYLRYENVGHNIIYDQALKVEVLKKAEEFLNKHLKDKK